ncbi:MAG TPA: AraC family transcriptional regulator [Polyangia bacterium]|nr:AraC family transcriptional regulator [Polyangia bacterium]
MKPKDHHRAEYEKRVNRVIDHIQNHRSDELTLGALAAVAAFSPFHFHRVFKAIAGENLREFIQRTRLESAASQLIVRPHVDILTIALENGFQSASVFARAFKERFGMNASDWRGGGHRDLRKDGKADRNLGQAKRNDGKAALADGPLPSFVSGNDACIDEENQMKTTVKQLPSYRVAYLRNVGPYGAAGSIPQLWQRLVVWAQARDLWPSDRVCLGITHDDPKVTESTKCRYDAAVVIPDEITVDGDVNVTEIPGGKHATCAFDGDAVEITAAWDQLFGVWLPQSGYQPEHRPCFELYRGDFYDPQTGRFRCDLCLPVHPL